MPPTATARPQLDHDRLNAARKAAGLRREQICADMGISYITLARWETGLTEPSFTMGLRLAELVGCDPRELVRR